MTAYYNENDPKAAAWLRQLIKNGDIAPGEVDERSILDVSASDIRGFTQHHFFAGIGVWSFALRNAGWSDDKPVCTASLPCQPFSTAGKRLGKDDERHLLPHFLDLVSQCGFNTIFGEQVESAIRHGWLDDLHTEMEAQGYAVGHAVLGAHSADSYHQRQRLYWVAQRVADTIDTRPQRRLSGRQDSQREDFDGHAGRGGADSGFSLADTGSLGRHESRVGNNKRDDRPITTTDEQDGSGYSGVVNSESGRFGQERYGNAGQIQRADKAAKPEVGFVDGGDVEWLYCRDGKYRPIKPGLKPLVDGTAEGMGYSGDPSQPIDADYSAEARVMRLKGYGNAIHAGTAQMFVESFMETDYA